MYFMCICTKNKKCSHSQELFSRTEVARRGLPDDAIVTSSNCLELEHHWAAVVDLIFQYNETGATRTMTHEGVTVKCVDVRFQGNGDVVGSGGKVVYIAREHANHFFPLFKQQFVRRS